MATLKKKARVLMLPTEKESEIYIGGGSGDLGFTKDYKPKDNGMNAPQHLYIIDDSGIKKGDWVYSKALGIIYQVKAFPLSAIDSKKVIATTDILLYYTTKKQTEESHYPLPQPSPQFIEKYVEAYNSGNPIVDVMVEYEIPKNESGMNICKCPWTIGKEGYPICTGNCNILKVDKNNYITIIKCKDSWNREEIIAIMKQFKKDCENFSTSDFYKKWGQTLTYSTIEDKWIEENL